MSSRDRVNVQLREAGSADEEPSGGLLFASEADSMRTPFRDAVLTYMYRTALELSDGCLEEASVSVWSNPGEEDSEVLDLTLVVRSDWEAIGKLRKQILVKISEWSQGWSSVQREDYKKRIYFGFVPAEL